MEVFCGTWRGEDEIEVKVDKVRRLLPSSTPLLFSGSLLIHCIAFVDGTKEGERSELR